MKPTLLVLAAGIGSRYGGLKQLDPVGPSGEIIIDYSIYDAIRAGFGKVVFVIRKDIEEVFKEKIGNKYAASIQVEYVFQELDKLPEGYSLPSDRVKPWGTGHAVLMAAEAINEPFAVINADDFYGYSGYKSLGDELSSYDEDGDKGRFAMVGFQLYNTLSDFGTVSRGICYTDGDNNLDNVVEYTKLEKDGDKARSLNPDGTIESLTGKEVVSMNMWGFSASLFDTLEERFKAFLDKEGNELKSEFFIPTVVNELIEEKAATVNVLTSEDSWFGITYQEDKPHVEKSLQEYVEQGIYPEKLTF